MKALIFFKKNPCVYFWHCTNVHGNCNELARSYTQERFLFFRHVISEIRCVNTFQGESEHEGNLTSRLWGVGCFCRRTEEQTALDFQTQKWKMLPQLQRTKACILETENGGWLAEARPEPQVICLHVNFVILPSISGLLHWPFSERGFSKLPSRVMEFKKH